MNQFSKDGVKKGRADGERAEFIGPSGTVGVLKELLQYKDPKFKGGKLKRCKSVGWNGKFEDHYLLFTIFMFAFTLMLPPSEKILQAKFHWSLVLHFLFFKKKFLLSTEKYKFETV